MMLDASIIIPTYNKAEYLSQVLDTLSKQVDDWFEIIVVDDGSTDNTKDVAQSRKVNYVKQEHKGRGAARARNNGTRLAKSDYLIFLDDDIEVCADYLVKVLESKNRYNDRVIQTGFIWDYMNKGDPDIRTQWGVWECPGTLTRRFYHIAGGNFTLYKSLYWETGGNDEDLIYQGVEDVLFGYLLSLIPNTFVVYNREMESFHLPHPKDWGRYDETSNWNVVKIKYPDFYNDYYRRGIR